jgi:hypothetical protein
LTKVKFAGHEALVLDGIEMSLFHQVAAMGVGSPVLLIHVDTQSGTAHWICLNDFVDKYLRPSGRLADAGKSSIYFNPRSLIDVTDKNFWMVEAIAQRGRLVSLFYLLNQLIMETDVHVPEWTRELMFNRAPRVDFRKTSGLSGLLSMIQQILAMKVGMPTESGGKALPGLRSMTRTLFALDTAISAYYQGDNSPNTVLVDLKDTSGKLLIDRGDLLSRGPTLMELLENLRHLVALRGEVARHFDKSIRWTGMPFPAPTNAKEAEQLYAARRGQRR